MNLSVTRLSGVPVLAVAGRLDSTNAAAFDQEAEKLAAEEPDWVILDLTALDFISSAGLRSLLILAKSLRKHHGELHFAGMQPQVQEVFAISGFENLFKRFPSVQAAFAKSGNS